MLDAATQPAPAHLDRPDDVIDTDDALEVVEPSEEMAAAYAEEPVTFTSVPPLPRWVVAFVAHLHEQHFAQLRTRPGRRALSAWDQSVAWCRVMLDDTEPDQIARDTGIARSTAHLRLAESEKIVAAQAPSLPGALLAPRAAGHRQGNLDGTLIETDRVSIPGPTTRKNTKKTGPKRLKVDLWWSGKHHCQSIIWREHPGRHRTRRMAAVGLRCPSRA